MKYLLIALFVMFNAMVQADEPVLRNLTAKEVAELHGETYPEVEERTGDARSAIYDDWYNNPARKKRTSKLNFTPEEPSYVVVTGPGEEVAEFVVQYQTALWPKWRENENYAKYMADKLEVIREGGKAIVWVKGKQPKAAYEAARKATGLE